MRTHDARIEIRIDGLRRRARRLWNTEPTCASPLRTTLLSRLALLEYELERLHYRGVDGRRSARSELDGLQTELAELEARWQPSVAAA